MLKQGKCEKCSPSALRFPSCHQSHAVPSLITARRKNARKVCSVYIRDDGLKTSDRAARQKTMTALLGFRCTRLALTRLGNRQQPACTGLVAAQLRMGIHVLASSSGEPWVSEDLAAKMNDKELLKLHGFIGGEWVAASDSTTFDVRIQYFFYSALWRQSLLKATLRDCQLPGMHMHTLRLWDWFTVQQSWNGSLKERKSLLNSTGCNFRIPRLGHSMAMPTLHAQAPETPVW